MRDARLCRTNYVLGFLATMAVLYPMAGQSFSLFGYHSRLIASVLIAVASLASMSTFSLSRARNGLALLCVAFVVLAFLYADLLQREAAFRIRFDTEYYNGKLARILQICLPVLVLAYLMSPSRHHAAFLSGTRCCIFVCGLIGLAVFFSYADYYLGQTFSDVAALEQEGTHHTCGISIVLSLAAILLLDRFPWKGWSFPCLSLLALVLLLAVLLLRQRAHMIMLAVLVLARFWSARTKLFSLAAVTIAFALVVGWIVGNYREYVLTETVRAYWQGAADGRMVEGRMELALQALEGIRTCPTGLGLGAFSLDHANKYPHNCVLEAFYELGVLGAIVVGSMCLMGLRQLPVLFRKRAASDPGAEGWFVRAVVVFLLAHVLKSGSLEHIGIFVYFLFITPNVFREGEKSRHPRPGDSAHAALMGPHAMHRPARLRRPAPGMLVPPIRTASHPRPRRGGTGAAARRSD